MAKNSRQARHGRHFAEKAAAPPTVPAASVERSPWAQSLLWLLTVLACALPLLSPWQRPPQPAFFNQALSLALWSLVALVATLRPRNSPGAWRWRGALPQPLTLLWLLLLATLALDAAGERTPLFLAAPIAMNLVVALLLGTLMLSETRAEMRRHWFTAALIGLLIGALGNALAALVQSVAPGWADDTLIAHLATSGERPGGNLRQPNLLATAMVWGLIAAVALLRSWPWLCAAVAAALFATLVASGSRAGMLALVAVLPLAWSAWRDGGKRRAPWLAAGGVLALTLGVALWHVFSRDTAQASLGQRLALWQQTLALIADAPWRGVGWAQLNFAWTLAPFANRAPDVFDHAHSLPLQLMAELGVPVTLLATLLLVAAIGRVRAWRAVRSAGVERAGALAAGALLLAVGVHSLFEYPLWFAHFLLPSAFTLAFLASTLAHAAPAGAVDTRAAPRSRRAWAVAAAASMTFGATLWGVHEYGKAAAIHTHGGDRAALAQAVARAQASPLYGQYGDYAAIMLAGDAAPLAWFARPVRNVLDERLLTAWARALEREGDHARAAWVVARAREFPFVDAFATLPAIASSQPTGGNVPRGAEDFRHVAP